ncbi:hypothetical protein [Lactococcus lactis]|uniref:hypothetical protein n=1 Tax=Lactococcus lactis TaxID=1358 RepID=UPI00345CC4F1
MILRDAIKYMELTGSDFITDLKVFGELQRSFLLALVANDFTEQYESFTDKLLILWVNKAGGTKKILKDELEIPGPSELIKLYCKTIFEKKIEETEKVFFSSSNLIKKKQTADSNKTLELLVFLANNEMNISQYLDMEIELVYKIIELVAEKKKEEREKEKRRKRKGM